LRSKKGRNQKLCGGTEWGRCDTETSGKVINEVPRTSVVAVKRSDVDQKTIEDELNSMARVVGMLQWQGGDKRTWERLEGGF